MPDLLPDYSIIQTKLYQPPLTEDLIPRSQLLQLLDGNHLHPLTVVSAPAGYGKTTFLSAWLQVCDHPNAWLSLDENDNDLVTFISYLLAAIRRAFPHVGEKTLPLLKTANLPPLATITSYLIFELDQIETDFVLVLDDFHVITNPDIHFLMMELLRHPHRAFHLVIATRRDPSLPLASYRARNLITEIRTQNLRFSIQETHLFLEQALGFPVDENIISILDMQTEGWPAGLRLASLFIKYNLNFSLTQEGMLGNNRFVSEYLMSEVIASLSPAIQDFLIKTAFLDRLCGPLCDAVIVPDDPQGNSQTYLEGLEDANIFIIPMDAKRQWYRFHHLFRDHLREIFQRRYTTDQIAALHRRASAWFAQNGLTEAAIDHSLVAGDVRTAIQLLDQYRHDLMNREQWQHLALILKKFPESIIDTEPELLVVSAWISHSQYQLGKTWQTVERLKVLMANSSLDPERARNLQISIDVFSSVKYNWAAEFPQAIFHAQCALSEAPRSWYMTRSYAWLHLILATFFLKGLKSAQEIFEMGQEDDFFDSSQDHVRVRAVECFMALVAADLPNLIRTASYLLKIAQANHLAESHAYAQYFLGSAYYIQNNLVEAEEHLRMMVEDRYVSHPNSFIQGAIGLALVYQAQGREEKADQTVDLAIQHCQEMGFTPQFSVLKAFQVDLALLRGDLAKATDWVKQADLHPPLKIMPYFFDEQMILPKILLAQNTQESLRQASVILSRLHEFVTTTHNTYYLIEVLALQALLYDALGDEQATFKVLTESLQLAQLSGIIRLYIDMGSKMAALIKRLQGHNNVAGFVDQLLNAFPGSAPQNSLTDQDDIIQPLTDRELDVLMLLVDRYSNKEIANKLFISPITVKRHTINIYQKLNVKSRREAAAKANDLGILNFYRSSEKTQ